MKRLLLSGIALFAFFAINAQTATSITTAVVTENPNAPEITFENLVHDYGTLQKGADGNTEFVFTNTGKEPLILSEVKTS